VLDELIQRFGEGAVVTARRATLENPPRDVPLRSFLTRYLWGEFVGEAEDLAMPELEYPHFEWTSRLKAFKRDGREVTITPEETPTARFSADVQFTPMRIEVWGPQGFHPVQGDHEAKVLRADGRIEDVELSGEAPLESPPAESSD
jgi:hypothetical protein